MKRAKMTTQSVLWIWNWVDGGYNSCRVATREEAVTYAREMARGTVLALAEATLHRGTEEELAALDRSYAGMFD